MKSLRIALSGSSGTGKTTLMDFISQTFDLPINPVGSRSVAQAMGFESPYDVDKAGRREEFQRRLLTEKMAWEAAHDSFVSDRTTLDNLAYTTVHDVHSITAEDLQLYVKGAQRYTHVFWCPVSVFCKVGGDAARVDDRTYQELYDVLIDGLLERFIRPGVNVTIETSSFEARTRFVQERLTR